MTPPATVSLSWVQTVLGEARRQGLAEPALLRAAGIAPQELASPRWPIDHITRLWRQAAQLSQDPAFGLKAGSQVGPASLNVLGFILLSSASLRQALGVLQKYQSLVSDGGRFQLLAGAGQSWLVYHPRQGDLAFSPHQIEAVLAAVMSASRWVLPAPLRPRQVFFSHEALGPAGAYREVFGLTPEFGQAFSGLQVDNAALDAPLPQAHPQLAQAHERLAQAELAALTRAQGLDQMALAWLQAHLGPPLPDRAQLARALGLGERTLARRLQALGTGHAQLLDQARCQQALQRVAEGRQSLHDIALALGFAELSPFYRAFRRWTGQTPAAWRQGAHNAALAHSSGEPA